MKQEAGHETQRMDHLGIVAGVCQEIGLIEGIDDWVGPSKRKVTVGEAVQAMVLNARGFVGRALYLSPEFFHNKPPVFCGRQRLVHRGQSQSPVAHSLDQSGARNHQRSTTITGKR